MTTGSWNMMLAFLNKDIISGAKQLLWAGRVSDVQRRNKIYLVLFDDFAFRTLSRKSTWLFTWWNNALSSCDLSDCLFDSWPPMPSLCIFALIEAPTRLRFSDFFLNFYSRLSKSSGKMGQIDQNWGAEYGHFYFGGLKNHKIMHLPPQPHFTMCTSINRVQLKIYQFS